MHTYVREYIRDTRERDHEMSKIQKKSNLFVLRERERERDFWREKSRREEKSQRLYVLR